MANVVLFSAYHLHLPFAILPNIVLLLIAPYIWASKHFRSNWFSVIVHGVGGVYMFVVVFLVVSGMAF